MTAGGSGIRKQVTVMVAAGLESGRNQCPKRSTRPMNGQGVTECISKGRKSRKHSYVGWGDPTVNSNPLSHTLQPTTPEGIQVSHDLA